MAYDENLTRLEKIVENLLDKLDSIQQEKNKIEAALAAKEKENSDLKAELGNIRQDKDKIHERVSTLISSIEKWESQSGSKSADAAAPAPDVEAEPDSNQKKLFRNQAMGE